LSSARVAVLLSIFALFTGIASSPSSTTQMSAAKKPLERAETAALIRHGVLCPGSFQMH
jgi:hypothetical protein